MARQTNYAEVLYRTKRYGKWIQDAVVIPETKTKYDDIVAYCKSILFNKLTKEQKQAGQRIREVRIENWEDFK